MCTGKQRSGPYQQEQYADAIPLQGRTHMACVTYSKMNSFSEDNYIKYLSFSFKDILMFFKGAA
jgi:hypothetical protein